LAGLDGGPWRRPPRLDRLAAAGQRVVEVRVATSPAPAGVVGLSPRELVETTRTIVAGAERE
jgi:hypothetical protein